MAYDMKKLQSNAAFKKAVSHIDKYYEIVYILLFVLYYYTQVTVLSGAPFFFVDFFSHIVSLVLPVIVVIWLARNYFIKRQEAIIGLSLAVFMMIISGLNGYAELKYLGLFTAGSIGVNLKKVIKCTVAISFIAVLYTFLYTFAVDPSINNVYVKGQRIRSAMGLQYPTDAASFIVYACFGFVMLGKSCPFIITFILSVVSLLLSMLYFDSITVAIISTMLIVAVIGCFFYEKNSAEIKIPKAVTKFAQPALYLLVPFLTAMQLILAFFYGKENSWAFKVDELLHKRVGLTYKGLTEYGITLFGKKIELLGAAAPGINNSNVYNYLDASYINIPVRYGLIVAVCILLMWIIIQKKAVESGNLFIIVVTVLISIHSFEEHHFAEIVYNPLLYLPFADGFENSGDLTESLSFIRNNAKKVIAYAIVVFGIMIFSPFIFSVTRTIADSKKYDNVSDRLDADSKAIKLILDANEYPVYADVLTEKYIEKFEGIKRSTLSGNDLVRKLNCSVITDADVDSPAFFSKGAVYARISDYSAVYTTDNSVITALRDAGYHVAGYYYPKEEPDVHFRFASDSIPVSSNHVVVSGQIRVDDPEHLDGEVTTVTFFAEDNTVSKTFSVEDIKEDGVINYELALDTKKDAVSLVIESMSEAGIVPTSAVLTDGSNEYSVDTIMSGIETDKTTVYEGKYTLKAHVELADNNVEGDIAVTLILSPEFGDTITKDLYYRDFSEDGTLDYETVFSSPGDYYSFSVETVGNAELKNGSFSLSKTPDYDVLSTYNSKGKVIRSEYYDLDGNKALSGEGVFAYEYEYDKAGNTTAIRYYDADNSPVISSNGFAEVHRKYDKLKHLIYESYFGEDGSRLTNQNGYAAFGQDVDVFGRATYIRYYDSNGDLTMTGYKYAAIRKEYDDDNRVIYEAYYDKNGDRHTMEDGYSACRYGYDDAGNLSKIIYLDDDDEPTIIKPGYAEIDREYDDNGRIISESYYDTEDELMLIDEGYATKVWIYDDFGDITSILLFGLETTSYIEIRREYDDQRRLIYEGKFNDAGEGQILSGDFSAYRQEYDDAGNIISVKYYGTDGNPMLIFGEYFENRVIYDPYHRAIYESYWGLDGEKATVGGFYHSRRYGYDDNNNRNVIKYYDTDDKPVANPAGVFEIKRTFDDSRRIASESYYGLNGEPVVNSTGYASFEREYDTEGNVSAERHYDLQGNLIDE